MKSMTGYGKAELAFDEKCITVEIKSLNSKQADIYTRLPNIYREKELEIRKLITEKLKRGKIDCSVTVETTSEGQAAVLNRSVIKNYYEQLNEVFSDLDIKESEPLLSILMRLPETLKPEKEILSEGEWQTLQKTIIQCLEELDNYRTQEGKSLENDIISRISNIDILLTEIEKFEKTRIENIKTRISGNMSEFFEEEKIDKNRFEQEIIYYLEKLDITEEKVRLKNHCEYFKNVVKENGDTGGKKLSFISQEIGREINTIGSKANDFNVQKQVVLMKDELEKIKEQLMNVL